MPKRAIKFVARPLNKVPGFGMLHPSLFSIFCFTYGGRLLQISLHAGVLACITAKYMADAPDERRSSRPKPAGNPNMTHYKTAQQKYKLWDPAAETEIKRLLENDKKTRLTSGANPYEHALLCHLYVLKEGCIHDFLA